MAIPHLNRTHVRRSQGASVVAKAAYNARQQLYDERTGTSHDYTRHTSKCVFEGLYLPKEAPEWAADRAELWNRVERAEKRKDAQLGQVLEIALPHELTHEQNRWLLQDFVRENLTRKGLAADVAIHAPSKDMDDRNIHAHILIPDRILAGDGFARTKPQKNRAQLRDELNGYRQSWEALANRHLERHGHDVRIDMGRTMDGDSVHLGKAAKGMEERGVETDRGDIQREQIALAEARAQVADLEALQRQAIGEQDQEQKPDEAQTLNLDRNGQGDAGELAPEDSRARWAEMLRNFSDEQDPHLQDLERKNSAGDRNQELGHNRGPGGSKPSPDASARTTDIVEERRSWAERLRGFGTQHKTRQADIRNPSARTQAATVPHEREVSPPALAHLRAAVAAGRTRLQHIAARLEGAFNALMERARSHDVDAKARALETDVSSRKAPAAPTNAPNPPRSHGPVHEDGHTPGKGSEEQRSDHLGPVRRSTWQDELRQAEVEAAAENLRQNPARQQDQTREWRP